jgi:hypothetical protein
MSAGKGREESRNARVKKNGGHDLFILKTDEMASNNEDRKILSVVSPCL